MSMKNITASILYVGADDTALDLFESQYEIPEGVSYNSYVIKDQKIAVMDTVDHRATDPWFDNLEEALDGKAPDYLVVSHMEPDHAGNVARFISKYPDTIVVGNTKTFVFMEQFFGKEVIQEKLPEEKRYVVKEGDVLSLGQHTLQFFMAPMVHWPEVMVAFEQKEKVLFSADGFGTFGALKDTLTIGSDEEAAAWADEARRYFINIVGKYGPSVQALLKKAAALEIGTIAPLHGPVLTDNLGFFIDKYMKWSSYTPEESGVVVAFSSLHGNTAKAAHFFGECVKEAAQEKGIDMPVVVYDLSRCDQAEAVAGSFQYDRIALLGVTYDGGLMPCMEDFLYHLKIKNFQNRKAAVVENGTWGPVSGKLMKEALEAMKNVTVLEETVTIRSVMNTENEHSLKNLAIQLISE